MQFSYKFDKAEAMSVSHGQVQCLQYATKLLV